MTISLSYASIFNITDDAYRGGGRITPGCNGGDCGVCADCIIKYG